MLHLEGGRLVNGCFLGSVINAINEPEATYTCWIQEAKSETAQSWEEGTVTDVCHVPGLLQELDA